MQSKRTKEVWPVRDHHVVPRKTIKFFENDQLETVKLISSLRRLGSERRDKNNWCGDDVDIMESRTTYSLINSINALIASNSKILYSLQTQAFQHTWNQLVAEWC